MGTRKEAQKRLERQGGNIKEISPKKYNYANKQVVVMPAPKQKKDLTDYTYGKDIDERVVKMATQLAERMAISLMREAQGLNVDMIVERVVKELGEAIAGAIPEQRTIIQQVVSDEVPAIKKATEEFVFEGANLAIDRSKGLKLHGDVGNTTESETSTDDDLDALDGLF